MKDLDRVGPVSFRGFSVLALLFLLSLVGTSNYVSGDGGFIPHIRLDVHESAQNAIILYDGGVERLYLSVNINADQPVEGFHIIPFPSMPRISLCGIGIFTNLTDYLNLLLKNDYHGRTLGDERGGNASSISIKLLETLGDHRITVIKIEDPSAFKDDLREVSTFLGIDITEWPENLDGTIQSYVDRGILYFTIDQYAIGPEDRTMDPLVFEFNTEVAFFPLEISSLFKGKGQIDITLITPDDLPMDMGPPNRFDQEIEFHLTSNQLAKIDRSLTERIPGDAIVYHISLNRELSELKGDLTFPVHREMAFCQFKNSYATSMRTACTDDMLITMDPYANEIAGLSLPGLERIWFLDHGRSLQNSELELLEVSGENLLLVFDSQRIERIDIVDGTVLWACQFPWRFLRDMDVNLLHSQKGPLIDINDVLFLDPSTGIAIPVTPVDNMMRDRICIAHGPDDIVAFTDEYCDECYLYSPFNISYFDPRDGKQKYNVSGKIPLYGGYLVLRRIMDEKYLQGRTMDLEEVLNFDDYVCHLNLSWIEENDLRYRTFCDPDFGIVHVGSSGTSTITCYDDETGQVRWVYNDGSWIDPRASFIDMDFDGTKELYLYAEGGPTRSLILESDGTTYLELNEFLPSLPMKRTYNAYVLAGRWNDIFCCYDLTDRSMRYYYPLPEKTADHFYDMTVIDWDEDGARMVFGILNDAGFILYRTGPTGFELITTMARYGRVIDLGSTIGIMASINHYSRHNGWGHLHYSRHNGWGHLYSLPYDGTIEKRTYPSINVPEENMGVEGFRKHIQGTPDEEKALDEGNSISFLDPAPIMIMILLMALFLNRGKRYIKKNRLKL